MKKRLLPFALVLTLFSLPAAIVRAEGEAPARKEGDKAVAKEPETELGNVMEDLNRSWRKVRKQVADPASNASSIELVAAIGAATEKATTLQPDKAKDLPEADRAKYIEGYQIKMKEFHAKLASLTAAFKANDNTGAQAIVKELGTMQREGHKEYKRPDK